MVSPDFKFVPVCRKNENAFEMCLCMFHTHAHAHTHTHKFLVHLSNSYVICHNRYFVKGDISNLSYLFHKRRDLQSNFLSCYVQIVDCSAAATSLH